MDYSEVKVNPVHSPLSSHSKLTPQINSNFLLSQRLQGKIAMKGDRLSNSMNY